MAIISHGWATKAHLGVQTPMGKFFMINVQYYTGGYQYSEATLHGVDANVDALSLSGLAAKLRAIITTHGASL